MGWERNTWDCNEKLVISPTTGDAKIVATNPRTNRTETRDLKWCDWLGDLRILFSQGGKCKAAVRNWTPNNSESNWGRR